jgi:hypothetical protein
LGNLVVALLAADRAPELLEPLTQGATGFGESPRSEEQESDDQHEEQVSWLKYVGEQCCVSFRPNPVPTEDSVGSEFFPRRQHPAVSTARGGRTRPHRDNPQVDVALR